jgi:hypothetical protein
LRERERGVFKESYPERERRGRRRSSRKLWKGMAWTLRVERLQIHTAHYCFLFFNLRMLPFILHCLS